MEFSKIELNIIYDVIKKEYQSLYSEFTQCMGHSIAEFNSAKFGRLIDIEQLKKKIAELLNFYSE